jgi:Helix-turn-helix domain
MICPVDLARDLSATTIADMVAYPSVGVERARKVHEVILRAMARKITLYQAAQIIGTTDRHMRRWRERYGQGGFDGVLDRRLCLQREAGAPGDG